MTRMPWVIGTGFMLGIAFVGIILIATILSLTSMSEANLPYVIYTVHLLALWIGGFISGKRAQEKGWYHGGMAGLLYAILLTIIGFLAFSLPFSLQHLLLWLGAFLVSAVGGIVGVNR
ncbi:TIGR04086 family membrane protein [Rubeoparvulum massiliense]|uniref:TIGR04086 family membrane protein n=1 Tax=Rubeoparvulum massiliense TaxID=1631346 RepID=UPI00065E7764|nr:TIGR04086 family membrane protein [Rubeoparvulum massiliense]